MIQKISQHINNDAGCDDEVLCGFDKNKCTIMLFLDLSTAVDTIDTEKLLQLSSTRRNWNWYGYQALQWFRSFLVGRTQKVKIKGDYLQNCQVLFRVPQWSVLSPKLL